MFLLFLLTSREVGKCRGVLRIFAELGGSLLIFELSLCTSYSAKSFTYRVLLHPIFINVETET